MGVAVFNAGMIKQKDYQTSPFPAPGIVEEILTPTWARKIAFAFLSPRD